MPFRKFPILLAVPALAALTTNATDSTTIPVTSLRSDSR
jgi:hypothetical protein